MFYVLIISNLLFILLFILLLILYNKKCKINRELLECINVYEKLMNNKDKIIIELMDDRNRKDD